MDTLRLAIALAWIVAVAVVATVVVTLNQRKERRRQKSRRNVDLIRQRLQETPHVRYRHVETRLGNRS